MHIQPTPAELEALTPLNPFGRFADGRPRVPDEVLDRLLAATTEQAWNVLHPHGYPLQFEGGWRETHPGRVTVGRALTAQFLPYRADFHAVVQQTGEAEGRSTSGGQNSWVIVELDDVNFYFRGADPTAIADVTLAGINIPVRIGHITVLPGDVVLGTPTGVIAIPPHLATEIAERAEDTVVRDRFGKLRLAEGTYTSGDIDVSVWRQDIEADFVAWRDSAGE